MTVLPDFSFNNTMSRLCAFLITSLITTYSASVFADRPNIVLVLADDLGFSDIAPYGGEVSTPNLTALAEAGIKFTNYHTAASCAPSRAMLLTGVDSHRNGVPNIPEAIPPEQGIHAHYAGTLNRNVVTVATLLQDGGYHTYLAGKWHLGKEVDQLPSRRGFERTVALADTGADNWEQKPYIPIYEKANWFADGEVMTLPDDFYSSRFLVDKTIEFIDSNSDSGSPFFAYVPFQAVHTPVQAPQEFIEKYEGVYDEGWRVLREQRLETAIALGIIPDDTSMVSMSSTEDWDSLSAEEKKFQSKRMAVYAAMIEAMDYHLGRLILHLREIGEYENTIFIFTSDNGSEASGSRANAGSLAKMAQALQGYSTDYETLGLKGSFNSIGPSFASAAASPLAYYKFYSGEGGMRVPLIIAGESISPEQSKTNAFSFVTDLTPTILELCQVNQPGERYGGRLVEPIIGRSLVSILDNKTEQVYSAYDTVGYELAGNAALFQGDYKLVLNRGPLGDDNWHLFNIVVDPGETSDLAISMPDKRQSMISAYERYARVNQVLPVPEGYQQLIQIAENGLRDRFGTQILILLATMSVLVLMLLFARNYHRQSER
ncbi:arylsulfatase [Pseudomonadales bacterium]|nr:arylsulfatase [Pseudomonadales bacterium]MDC1083231.1 arylsulfatase [Pseudomonadales bacterium]MDC6450538.1 arylsulfatase [Pseudomonadales bacterium]